MTSYMMTGEQVDYSGQNHLITLAKSNLLNYLDGASLDVMQNQDNSFHLNIFVTAIVPNTIR